MGQTRGPGQIGSSIHAMRNLTRSPAKMNGAQHSAMSIDDLLAAASLVRALVRRAESLTEAGDFPQTLKAAAMLKDSFEAELETNLIAVYDKPPPKAYNGVHAAPEQPE